jgi:nucleotidyltransferase/DNA polymerase involved in DNA repair
MPVERLYGVGPKSAKILNDVGVMTIGDLARKSVDELDKPLGRKFALYLWNAANGVDDDPVTDGGPATQVSRIITLKRDSSDVSEIMSQLDPAVQDIHRKLLEGGISFRSVSVVGILKDLSTKTRSRTLDMPTNDLSLLRREAAELLTSLTAEGFDLRRTGVRVSDLSESQAQSSLAEYLG